MAKTNSPKKPSRKVTKMGRPVQADMVRQVVARRRTVPLATKPKNDGNVPRRPRRDRTEQAPRNKVSIAVAPEDLAWATTTARSLGLSVSGLYSKALENFKRRHDLSQLLERIGGTSDITEEDREAIRAEWREAGLLP